MAKTYKKGGGGDTMATFQKQMMSAVTEVAKESQGKSHLGQGVEGWDLMAPDVFGADGKKKKSGSGRDRNTEDFFDGTPDQDPDRLEGEHEDWELDDDDGLEQMRLARLEQMKQQRKETMELKAKGHGEYTEIEEQQFLKDVTSRRGHQPVGRRPLGATLCIVYEAWLSAWRTWPWCRRRLPPCMSSPWLLVVGGGGCAGGGRAVSARVRYRWITKRTERASADPDLSRLRDRSKPCT